MGQRHAPAVLPSGKTQYPLYRRLSRLQGRSGQVWKISPPPGFDSRTVQPVASRYTDCATRPTNISGSSIRRYLKSSVYCRSHWGVLTVTFYEMHGSVEQKQRQISCFSLVLYLRCKNSQLQKYHILTKSELMEGKKNVIYTSFKKHTLVAKL